MSNTIGFGIARNQDTDIRVPILTAYAATSDKDRPSLRIPPAWWQTASALGVRLLPQATSHEAVTKETLVPDPWACMLVFRRMLQGIPAVEKLLARAHDWGLMIWVIVNNSTADTRYQIYDKEWELMQRFSGLGVNFHVIDRQDRPLEQLITLQDIDLQFAFRELSHAI